MEMLLIADLGQQYLTFIKFKGAEPGDVDSAAKKGLNIGCYLKSIITVEDSHFFTLLP